MTVEILRRATNRTRLAAIAEAQFGDMVKAVVDVDRRVMAIGGELQSDEAAALIDDGSAQENLWGINLYPERSFATLGAYRHRSSVVELSIRNPTRPAPTSAGRECFVETGDGRAGFGPGDFYAEPTPQVNLRAPGRWWHWGKVLFERRWLRRWF